MSDGRKRLSGAEYRAEAKEKLAKQRKVVEQSVKIQSYFKKSSETSNDNILPPNPIENVLTDITISFVRPKFQYKCRSRNCYKRRTI